jgi:hypothetical protein
MDSESAATIFAIYQLLIFVLGAEFRNDPRHPKFRNGTVKPEEKH